jgi:hypothetical protein
MDSGSSSIVELGRFMTGFFVVMGIGTLDFTIQESTCGQDRRIMQITREKIRLERLALTLLHSSSHCAGSHRTNPRRGHDHEHHWRSPHLRNHHQLHYVLPGAGRVLVASEVSRGNLQNWERCFCQALVYVKIIGRKPVYSYVSSVICLDYRYSSFSISNAVLVWF